MSEPGMSLYTDTDESVMILALNFWRHGGTPLLPILEYTCIKFWYGYAGFKPAITEDGRSTVEPP